MQKKYALLISALITLLIFANYSIFYDNSPERESVKIKKAIDGDTLDLEDGRRIRLLNINTPEKDQPFYKEALDYLKQYENKTLEMEFAGTESYGRTLGRLYQNDKYINLEIISLGFAHISHIEEEETRLFLKEQEKARKSNIGIWKKSPKFNCLTAEINSKEEFVIIINNCGNLKGFTLKDESTTDFRFPDTSENEIVLFSAGLLNNSEGLSWGRGNSWNDDKDSIFVRDKEGLLVFYDSYGY